MSLFVHYIEHNMNYLVQIFFLIEEEDVADSDFDQSSGTDNDNEDAEEQLQKAEKKERQVT